MMHYHSCISDDSRQDSRTTFINTEELIKSLRGNHGLLSNAEAVLFELMDGCTKQYRSATACYLMSVLAVKYGLSINRMISAPSHGKGDCDSQGGIDKSHLRQYFRSVATPEKDRGSKVKVEPHMVEKGKRISMAAML